MGNDLYAMVNFKADEYKRIMFIFSAISRVIFTQIKAKVKWNLGPRGGLGLWPRIFEKNPFQRIKTLLNGDVFT